MEFDLPFPADFPSNCQLKAHVGEFLKFGYKSGIGNIETKFPFRDGSRSVSDFSVGCTDGQCKIVLMMSIVGIAKELEFTEKEMKDNHLAMVLGSFAQIRCSYEHFDNPAHFFLYSLRT